MAGSTDFAPAGRPDPGQAIDPCTGAAASPGGKSVDEWFIAGTEPKDALAAGHLRHRRPARRRSASRRPFEGLDGGRRDWIRRAERGPGVARRPGPDPDRLLLQLRSSSRTARRGASSSAAACGRPSPSPIVLPDPDPGRERRDPVASRCPSPTGRPWRPSPARRRPACRPCSRPSRSSRARVRGVRTTATDRSADGGANRSTDRDAHRTPTPAPTDAPTAAPPTPRPRPRPRHRRPSSDACRRAVTVGRAASIRGVIIELHDVVVRRAGRTILGPLDWHVARRRALGRPRRRTARARPRCCSVDRAVPVADRRHGRRPRRALRQGRRARAPTPHRLRGERHRGAAARRPDARTT